MIFVGIFSPIYLSRVCTYLTYNCIRAITNMSHLQIDPVVSSPDADVIHSGYLPHVIDVRCNISRKLHVLGNRSNARCMPLTSPRYMERVAHLSCNKENYISLTTDCLRTWLCSADDFSFCY